MLLQYDSVSRLFVDGRVSPALRFTSAVLGIFEDDRVFDPRMICGSVISRDIAQHKAIPWLIVDANTPYRWKNGPFTLHKVRQICVNIPTDSESAEHFDISCY